METELQEHLDEQRAALAQVHEALQEAVALGDAPCEEAEVLRQMASELQAAIQELEAALLEMARARLLAALDPISATTAPEPPAPQGAPAEPISTAQACAVAVGEPCRFRGLDGRWYAGRLIALEAGTAVVQHAMPTRRHMLDPLRMSASSLRPTRAITSEAQHAVGDIVYVRPAALTGGRPTESSRQGSLWQPADVVEVDELAGTVVVLLGPQRLRLRIAADDATPSAAAGNSDLDSSSSSSSSSDDSSSRQKSHDGEQAARGADEGNSEPRPASEHAALQHVRAALQAGANTSTVHFSTWERHTRGVASKLMAGMGYRMGSGLGASGRGRAEPVPAIILPPKVGLGAGPGAAGQADGANEDAAPDGLLDRASKRRKGRARRQRRGLQRRTAREAAEDEALQQEKANGAPGLFGFINVALGDASEAASKIRAVERALLKQDRVVPEEGGSGGWAAPQGSKQGSSRDTQQALMDQHQAINACQAKGASNLHTPGSLPDSSSLLFMVPKVAHFQAMLARNRSNPGLAPAIASKLRTAQAELAAAQAEQSRVTSSLRAVAQKQAYMKF